MTDLRTGGIAQSLVDQGHRVMLFGKCISLSVVCHNLAGHSIQDYSALRKVS